MKTQAGAGDQALYLPDFCTSRATLAIVLIVELTARGFGDEDISATYRLKSELFERTNIMKAPPLRGPT